MPREQWEKLHGEAWTGIVRVLGRGLKESRFFESGGMAAINRTLRLDKRRGLVTRAVLDAFRLICVYKDGAMHIDEEVMDLVLGVLSQEWTYFADDYLVVIFEAFGYLAVVPRWSAWFSEKKVAQHILLH